MDHNQGATSGDYAWAAANDAKDKAKDNAARIAVLEREVARLGQIIDKLVRKAGRL
jgi:hypothetical protein